MAGRIFVNYRRGDDPGFTHALYQHLEREFTTSQVFMDVQGHIKPGDDFIDVLNTQVAGADIVLVVVGPRWVELMTAHPSAREDFVAIEITAALEARKRVIPVLVGGAKMPAVDALPETIRALVRRNAVELRPERFKTDCQDLVIAIKDQLAALDTSRVEHEQRAAAEAARQVRETEEAARAQRANEHQRERERTASREREEDLSREASKEAGDDDAQLQRAAELGRRATDPDILPFRVPRAAASTLGVGVLGAIGGAIAGATIESATVNVFGRSVLYSQALTAGVVMGVALLLVARVKALTSVLVATAAGTGWFVSEILLSSATSSHQTPFSSATLVLWGIGNWSSPALALALLNPGGKSRPMWLVVVIAGGVVGLIYQQTSTLSLVTQGAIFMGVPMACIGSLLDQRRVP